MVSLEGQVVVEIKLFFLKRLLIADDKQMCYNEEKCEHICSNTSNTLHTSRNPWKLVHQYCKSSLLRLDFLPLIAGYCICAVILLRVNRKSANHWHLYILSQKSIITVDLMVNLTRSVWVFQQKDCVSIHAKSKQEWRYSLLSKNKAFLH